MSVHIHLKRRARDAAIPPAVQAEYNRCRKIATETSKKIDRVVAEGGRVGLGDPLSILFKRNAGRCGVLKRQYPGLTYTGDATRDALKLIQTYTSGSNQVKVYKDDEWGEYRARLFFGGRLYEPADYHSDDKADALSTAQAMLRHAVKPKGWKDASRSALIEKSTRLQVELEKVEHQLRSEKNPMKVDQLKSKVIVLEAQIKIVEDQIKKAKGRDRKTSDAVGWYDVSRALFMQAQVGKPFEFANRIWIVVAKENAPGGRNGSGDMEYKLKLKTTSNDSQIAPGMETVDSTRDAEGYNVRWTITGKQGAKGQKFWHGGETNATVSSQSEAEAKARAAATGLVKSMYKNVAEIDFKVVKVTNKTRKLPKPSKYG